MRGDEADAGQRTRVSGGEVHERRLEERAVLAVEVAVVCRDVSRMGGVTVRYFSVGYGCWRPTVLQVTDVLVSHV